MEELKPLDINGIKKAWNNIRTTEFKQGIINGLSKHNSEIALAQLKDFENGINCTTQGIRTPASLLRIRRAYITLSKKCKGKNIEELTKQDISKILIKEKSEHFARNIKVIFNWLERTDRIKENPAKHISPNFFSNGKPAWVYLGEEGTKSLMNNLASKYRALTSFLLDSGIRPEEAWRIRVFDFQEDYTMLDIPDKRSNGERVAKKNSFGRKIKLKLCPTLIKEYVKFNNLKPEDLLFTMTQAGFNKALRVSCIKLFGKNPTKARESPDKITAYDLRHNSACFWLKRYKTNKDLMYRFGWKSENKVFYYTEFLDMRDKIDDEDLITSEDKTKLENQVRLLETDNKKLNNKLQDLDSFYDSQLKNKIQDFRDNAEFLKALKKQIEEIQKNQAKIEMKLSEKKK